MVPTCSKYDNFAETVYVPTPTFYTPKNNYLVLETENHFIKAGIEGIEILNTLDNYKDKYNLFETAYFLYEDDYFEEEISMMLVGEKLLSYKMEIGHHCLQFENFNLLVCPYKEKEEYCSVPYDYPIHCFDRLLTRKCSCGGKGVVFLVKTVNDYLIRCDKCHISTYAYQSLRDVINTWDKGETPINLTFDFESFFEDVKKGINYISFSDSGYYKYDDEHFDCEYVIPTKAGKYIIRNINFKNLTTGFSISKFNDCNEEYAKEKIVSEKDKPIIYTEKSPLYIKNSPFVIEFFYGDRIINILSIEKGYLEIRCATL